MSAFALKLIACITMVLDHMKLVIPGTQNIFTYCVGRIAFPIFAFLITQGYIHTKDLNKYTKRLAIFGFVSQIPYAIMIKNVMVLNIMFTLLMGLFAITIYDKIKKKYISIPICLLTILVGEFINVDYGWFGISLILILYIFRDRKKILLPLYILLVILYFFIRGMLKLNPIAIAFGVGYIISIILILLYNGKQGKKMKYFFYCFYPLHMIILDFILLF